MLPLRLLLLSLLLSRAAVLAVLQDRHINEFQCHFPTVGAEVRNKMKLHEYFNHDAPELTLTHEKAK